MRSTGAETDDVAGAHVALVAVTDAERPPAPLIEALAEHHPALVVRAVWTGDPQLRPRDAAPWIAAPADHGPAWERHLLTADRQRSTWTGTADVARRVLDAGARSVLALEAGSVAVV